MAGVPSPQRVFALEAIYSSDYSKVLSITAAYDYMLTKGSGKNDSELCRYIDHRNGHRVIPKLHAFNGER